MLARPKLPILMGWTLFWLGAAPAWAGPEGGVRFRTLPIQIDSGAQALAAYQIELTVTSGRAEIVGVEGGDPAPFAQPPYYDARALHGGRIILAAFSTASDLPRGSARFLSVHVMETGKPASFAIRVLAAADRDGKPVPISVAIADPAAAAPRDTGRAKREAPHGSH